MKPKFIILVLTSFILHFQLKAQYKVEVLDTNNFMLGTDVVLGKTSFRGLSVVDDQTIWVSGNRGTFAISIDGGQTFVLSQIEGYEKSDFRDIEAFDANRAIVMSSGTPALILKTIDGGQSWKEVFRRNDSAYFLDAMDFWNDEHGLIVGDPINSRFVFLESKDGGETWVELDQAYKPKAQKGESLFAASGTSLRCWDNGDFGFVTGGEQSRYISYSADNQSWWMIPSEIVSGKNSTGAFSFTSLGPSRMLIVGGDYMNDTATGIVNSTIIKETNGPMLNTHLSGYKSCVEPIDNAGRFISCGTSGVDLYNLPQDKGWVHISKESFHVVRKAKKGKAVILAGAKGKIGKLIY